MVAVSGACYWRGTMILTEKGEIPVEKLRIGARVITASGEAKPVKWIGHRKFAGRFATGNLEILPVVLRAGSLGGGVPVRDLWVSPTHALLIGDVLVEARHLVNGITVVQKQVVDWVAYFHVELEEHDVILADGAPAETYLEWGNRQTFHNAAEFAALYPDDARPRGSCCAPVLEAGTPQLAEIWDRLRAMAEAPAVKKRA